MKKVLVTGANGHLGYTLTEMLVERGYTVHAGMRNIDKVQKSAPLRSLGVELAELDITKPGQIASAVIGMDGVFHVAAVFQIAGDPQAINRPTVEGAMAVIRAAHSAGVRKVIYTSSGRTLGNSSPPESPLDDQSWNQNGRVPYTIAKTEAEKRVWEYAHANHLNLVSILPLLILGPNFHRLSESTAIIDNILHDRYPVIPPIAFNIVDVRDAALAHILAYENPQANGRYIVGHDPITMDELLATVNEIHPIRIPKIHLTKMLFLAYASVQDLRSRVSRKPPQITLAQAREMSEGFRYVDRSRTDTDLGLKLRSPREAIHATVDWLKHHSISD